MKVIDFERKGNVVRFYLGADDCNDYWGDDWNDCPYEHNAGEVYDRFVVATKDVAFPFDYIVLEPCDGECNSNYSKQDMIDRVVPCVIAVPQEVHKGSWKDRFKDWIEADGIIRIYFGDDESTLEEGK